MGRPKGSEKSEQRVQRLVDGLFSGFPGPGESVASLASSASLRHETVRSLLKNPQSRRRAGPGFLVVARIAEARNVSLDALAASVLAVDAIGESDK
jgi:hypothetical protein